MAVLGVSSVAPAFPLIIDSLPLFDSHNIGLIITFFTIPGVVLTPIMGVLADRYGRKRILVPSLLLFGLAGFSCGFAPSFHILLGLRFLQGVGAASLGALNITLIGDLFPGDQRSAALGLNAGVLSLGVASYPVIGGALASLSWNYPFFLPIIAVPLALIVLFFLDNPEPKQSDSFSAYFKSTLGHLSERRIFGLLLATLMTFILIYGPFLTYMPVHLGEAFNASPLDIGLIMGAAALVTALIASQLGRISKLVPEKVLIRLAFIAYALAALSMSYMPSLWMFFFPVLLFGIGQGLNIPSIQSLLAGLAPMEQRGAFMAVNGMVLRMGQTIAPLLMGLIFGLWGIDFVFIFSSILALVMFGLTFWFNP